MSEQLRELHSRVERLRALYHRALADYNVLLELKKFTSRDNYDRLEADDHKMMFTAFKDFFNTIKEALFLDAHIQLAKILIDNEEALQLRKLIRYARSEDRKITKARDKDEEIFRESIKDFGLWYKGLTPQQLEKVKTQLEVHEWLISKLELIRNKKLVHEHIKDMPAELLTLEEILKLIKLCRLVLNELSLTYGGWDHKLYKLEDVGFDTKHVLERLYKTYLNYP